MFSPACFSDDVSSNADPRWILYLGSWQ